MTERFHFYRRYRIRGAKTIVWYQAPEHAQFYSEVLQTPFLPSQGKGEESGSEADVVVDEGEISALTLYSRYDRLRMERVVGTRNWGEMVRSGDGRSVFL
jgi:U3 small nucleolar RNA-associated protein 25